MRKYVIALAVTVVALFALSSVWAFSEMPAVGSAAPTFKLATNEGNEASLGDFKGKWVVLYFYPKDITSGCTLEARKFKRDLEK
jgi:peroxiredoxin Q/BCP